ncbi:hypothetical protein [Longimycelium tulufanense]|uniref:hypothetical protein n=1 Tax=Longimycelium tulufanense TaxID=907463 RepID=UPI001664D8D6|nr:hypothetical protein [Longimycelium tulufanense]
MRRAAGSVPPRGLDRLLRGVRAHLRVWRLPRPDRLVIYTASRSVTAEITQGRPPDRLAALLAWAWSLQGVTATWGHGPAETVTVLVSGRTCSGIGVHVSAAVRLAELGDQVRPGPGGARLACWATGSARLPVGAAEAVTCDELAAVVAHLRAAERREVRAA